MRKLRALWMLIKSYAGLMRLSTLKIEAGTRNLCGRRLTRERRVGCLSDRFVGRTGRPGVTQKPISTNKHLRATSAALVVIIQAFLVPRFYLNHTG